MYRDPSEFRERFKAYKEGKSVREIYGLPGYAGGKSTIEDTADFLKQYEGFRDKTYLDGKGIPTIGYGFMDAKFVNKGRITKAEADAELKRQIAFRLAKLRKKLGPAIWDSLSNDSKKALTSYHYNYPAGFEDDTKFMKYWRSGLYAKAIKEVDAGWNDSANPGLRTRRMNEQLLLFSDPVLGGFVVPEAKPKPIIAMPDATRVSTIPTIQLKAIDYSDRRNAVAAETLRAIWAHNVMEDMKGAYQVPIWESPSLPALEPIELDVTPLKTYADGKLPRYQNGRGAVIQQGHKQIPIDNIRGWARHHDADEDYKTAYWKNVIGSGIDFVEDITNHWRRILNNRGTVDDVVDATIDIATGAAGKIVKDSAKRLIKNTKRAAKKAIKPTEASTKKMLNAREVSENLASKPKTRIDPKKYKQQTEYTLKITDQKTRKYNKTKLPSEEPVLNSADFPENTNINALYGPEGMLFSNKIVNNDRLMDIAVPHEFKHYLQQYYNYTPELAMIMERAFPFSEKFIKEHPDFNFVKEGGAMLSELEYEIGKRYGFPVGKDFEDVVNHITPAEIEDMASKLSVYNRDASEQRIKHIGMPDVMPLTPEQARFYNNFKDMLLKVPVVAGGAMVVPKDKQYKDGKLPGYSNGKIRIKPANRGKFNATKKRTGKTTEELTHSKNPLTRKRAIFVQNARKWKH